MSNDELVTSLRSHSGVIWGGRRYNLQGITAQWVGDQIVYMAILIAADGTVYQVKPEHLRKIY